MAGLLDDVMGALGGAGGSGGLGGLLGGAIGGGADDTKVEAATQQGVAAILSGLARNAQDGDGAASLLGALQRDHDGSALDDVGSTVGNTADGEKILGHVFGANSGDVAQRISADSGLDLGQVTKLLPAIAPVVMGMLGKKTKDDGLDAGGLAGMLGGSAGGFDLGGLLGMLGGGGSSGSSGGAAGGLGGLGGVLGKLKGLLGGRR